MLINYSTGLKFDLKNFKRLRIIGRGEIERAVGYLSKNDLVDSALNSINDTNSKR